MPNDATQIRQWQAAVKEKEAQLAIETMRVLWGSGFVNRWHCNEDPRLRNSGDTTAAHQQRVAVLLAFMNPDANKENIVDALLHDAPEVFTGDVPRPAKRDIPNMQSALDDADRNWWATLGVLDPPEAESFLYLADKLDAWLFVKLVAPDLLDKPEWSGEGAKVITLAVALNIGDIVRRVMAP